jgi:ATP-dependent Clp protease ATP-binding subunit ClpC
MTGPAGCGKTAIIRLFANRLREKGWIVFEASANDLVAGQMFVGQIEGRVRELVRELSGKDVVWIIPAFHELAFAGAHNQKPTGVLDALLPHIESGELRVMARRRPTPGTACC